MASSVFKLLGVPPRLQQELAGLSPVTIATLFSLPYPNVNWAFRMSGISEDKITPEDSRIQHEYIYIDGRRWHYVDAKPTGTPKGVIFLVHGFPDIWFAWRYQIPLLLNLGLRCIIPDCMGYGGTDAPTIPPATFQAYSFKSHADAFATIAKKIGADRIILGGHDWGGMVVYRFAQHYPDLVTHVFSVATPYLSVQENFVPTQALVDGPLPNFGYQLQFGSKDHVIENAITDRESIRKLLKAAYGGQVKSHAKLFSPKTGLNIDAIKSEEVGMTPLFSHEELEYYVEQFYARGMNGPCNWYRTREVNHEEDLQIPEASRNTIKQPTLFVACEKDDVLLPSMSAGMEENIPNLSRASVPASHWALWHTPRETNAAIKKWFESVVFGGQSKL